MGMNQSRALNVVRSAITSSVALVLNNSAGCNTAVYGSNIINISNAHDIDISDIKNKVFIKMDATCIISQASETSVAQKISQDLQQQAEAITSGLGMNAADSANLMSLMTNLSVAVQSSIVASITNLAKAENLINITDSSGVTARAIEQTAYIDVVSKSVVSQSMKSQAGQEVETAITQAAKAKSEGFNLSMGLIVFIVAAIVGTVFVVSWKKTITTILMNPMTWLLVTTPLLIGTTSLFIGGLPKKKIFWPYQQDVSTDTASERSTKKSKNLTIMMASGVASVFLLLLDSALVFATFKTYSSTPATQQFW